jgi:hypothetical protein
LTGGRIALDHRGRSQEANRLAEPLWTAILKQLGNGEVVHRRGAVVGKALSSGERLQRLVEIADGTAELSRAAPAVQERFEKPNRPEIESCNAAKRPGLMSGGNRRRLAERRLLCRETSAQEFFGIPFRIGPPSKSVEQPSDVVKREFAVLGRKRKHRRRHDDFKRSFKRPPADNFNEILPVRGSLFRTAGELKTQQRRKHNLRAISAAANHGD